MTLTLLAVRILAVPVGQEFNRYVADPMQAIRDRRKGVQGGPVAGAAMYLVSSGAEVLVHTPAKINLFLEVLGRRPDGYHEIETCMAAISLFDTLSVRSSEHSEIRLNCRWVPGYQARSNSSHTTATFGDVPNDSRNLVYRAVDRLRNLAGMECGADIELLKRIPAAAGLGGASSDAAAALVAANYVWKLNWPRQRLVEIGAEIGSDVAFFLGSSRNPTFAAICRGRGEVVSPVPVSKRLHIVLVKPPVGLATSSVYQNCKPANEPKSVAPLLHALDSGQATLLGGCLFNRLGESAGQLSRYISNMTQMLQKLNCLGFLMSGSGTSFFALCRHHQHARRLSAVLRGAGVGAVYCVTTVPLASAAP